jgi:2,4-dienoyl-CoA reductase-like NADH-dependent reductase (Old Yellow Enzyme family)
LGPFVFLGLRSYGWHMIIAYEKTLPLAILAPVEVGPLFVRIDIEQNIEISELLPQSDRIPMLYHAGALIHPARLSPQAVEKLIEAHIAYAQRLKELGFTRVVIAADNDGALQKILSPRLNSLGLAERMESLISIYKSVVAIIPHTMVLMPVEELAPGGLDATDGIAIAQELERLGLKEMIATSGTKDFWPLYDRRATKKKQSQQDDFYSNEPSLASAAWLVQHTNLNVWCLAFVDDQVRAQAIAESLGLVGIIHKASVDI